MLGIGWRVMVGVVVCMLGGMVVAGDQVWTQYRRYGNHSGFSDVIPYHSFPSVKWSFKTQGIADTSLILSDATVFFGDATGTLRAVDKNTGRSVWNFTIGGSISATPCLINDHIVAAGIDGTVYKIDKSHGFERWRSFSAAPILSSPLCLENDIAIVADQNGIVTKYNMALNLPEVMWSVDLDGLFRAAPALSSSLVILCNAAGNITGLDFTTGKVVWNLQVNGSIWDTPSINDKDGILYVGALNSYILYAIEFTATSASIKWEHTFPVTVSFGSVTPAILPTGDVVFGAWDYRVVCYDGQTGQEKWVYRLGEWLFSSPIVSDNVLAFGGITTALHFISFQNEQSLQTATMKLEGYVMGSPATDGVNVYVLSRDGGLYCIGERKRSVSSNTLLITAIVASVCLVVAAVVAYICSKKYHSGPKYAQLGG
eukprot:m.6269 g.6269  ORF g.6269 m.6269 type:complete len:428 (-) comp2570_c0_seq1:1242-2525(-)